MKKMILTFGVCSCVLFGCDKNSEMATKNIADDFEVNKNGWKAGFADYSTAMSVPLFGFDTGIAALPAPLDASSQAFRIGAKNLSDDLFMFLKKEVTGLTPNATYTVDFQLDIASSAPSNYVGIGGPPGEAVYVKVGATPVEPMVVLQNDFYSMNIDKGNQSNGGADMTVIGNVANGLDTTMYKMIQRQGTVSATADALGNLWLIVGTDSGFEGLTVLYYDEIKVDIH